MNFWNEKFKSEQYVYGTEPNAFLKAQVDHFNKGNKIACYAEGEGRNAVYLAQCGLEVTAYDYAREGLLKTEQLAKQMCVNVQTKLADLLKDELKTDTYDGAVMIFGHFAKSQQYDVLNKIMNSLKQGGLLLLEVYEDGQLAFDTGGPKNLEFLYNEKELQQWANQFEVLHFDSIETERFEGVLHTGRCKVLQLIISK